MREEDDECRDQKVETTMALCPQLGANHPHYSPGPPPGLRV